MDHWLGRVLLAILAMASSCTHAELTEGQARAGFLYNVARFVEWPQQAFTSAAAPLVICTRGLRPEVEAAMPLIGGKLVGARPIYLESEPAEAGGCHILYLGQFSQDSLRELVQPGWRVLVVSDVPGTLGQGAAVEIVPVGKRLTFNVHLGAARRAGLKLGAPLLRLAHEVVQP